MTLPSNHVASYVAEPLRVSSETEVNWSEQVDVVVVGFGAAGVCAALEARESGADVLAVDRFEGGGATTLSGGIVYGGGTKYQKQAGVEDSADEMFKYLRNEIGDAVREETLRRFCNDSSSNFDWLVSHGLGFGSELYEGKRSYPPIGFDLYYSGNELAAKFATVAKPAARGHRVSGSGYTGEDFYQTLAKASLQKGVRLSTHTVARRMVVDANNRVIGVEVGRISEQSAARKQLQKLLKKVNAYQRFIEKSALKALDKVLALEKEHGETVFIRARKGVILTTGSFAFNRTMVRHYAPNYAEAMALGTISCDGSGIVLGQSVGGDVGHMDSVTAWRTISPPVSFVGGIVVNKSGKRFEAEDAYLGRLGYGIAHQQDQRAWLIIDSKTYWRAYKDVIPRWGEEGYLEFRGPLLVNLVTNSTRGKTLGLLAEKIGVDPKGLESEVSAYNHGVEVGEDRFLKKASNCRVLEGSAYWAIEISVGSKKFACPTIPMGGLKVDESTGSVLDNNGDAISGLYAAGRAAVGIPSGFYVSGSSLADCVFSGRRAAHHAANS